VFCGGWENIGTLSGYNMGVMTFSWITWISLLFKKVVDSFQGGSKKILNSEVLLMVVIFQNYHVEFTWRQANEIAHAVMKAAQYLAFSYLFTDVLPPSQIISKKTKITLIKKTKA